MQIRASAERATRTSVSRLVSNHRHRHSPTAPGTRANDSSAQSLHGRCPCPLAVPPLGRCSDRRVTSVTSNLVYGPGHRPRVIIKAVGDRGGMGTMGRPRPGVLPTWPDTNKGGSLYDPSGSGQYDGGTPGSDGSDNRIRVPVGDIRRDARHGEHGRRRGQADGTVDAARGVRTVAVGGHCEYGHRPAAVRCPRLPATSDAPLVPSCRIRYLTLCGMLASAAFSTGRRRHQPPSMSGSQEKQPDGHAEVSLPQGSAGATDRKPERL
jgi:hypothetical protein